MARCRSSLQSGYRATPRSIRVDDKGRNRQEAAPARYASQSVRAARNLRVYCDVLRGNPVKEKCAEPLDKAPGEPFRGNYVGGRKEPPQKRQRENGSARSSERRSSNDCFRLKPGSVAPG